jgi:hypothetical protein
MSFVETRGHGDKYRVPVILTGFSTKAQKANSRFKIRDSRFDIRDSIYKLTNENKVN